MPGSWSFSLTDIMARRSCGVVGPPSQFPYRCERGEVEDWKCRKRRRDTVGVVALPGGVWSTSPVVSGRHVSPL